MPRLQRLILPGVAAHIVQRGHNRKACFFGPTDYRVYLHFLQELALIERCAVHAFCLMGNHVHLLLTPPSSEACATLMKGVAQRYAQYVNRTYGRTGSLWEGRYRSCVADSARYVLACYRYIELNPVRAAMVAGPADYPWSSYRANIGVHPIAWLSPHPEFVALASDPGSRAAAYRDLVGAGLETSLLGEVRSATRRGYRLGSRPLDLRALRYQRYQGGQTPFP